MRSNDLEMLKSKLKIGDSIFLYRNGSYVGVLSSFLRTDEDIHVELNTEIIAGVVVIEIVYMNKTLVMINADEWE